MLDDKGFFNMIDSKIGNFHRVECANQAVLLKKSVGMVFAYINDK
ncbi:hypothetical protein ACFWDG_09120 [Peribacillus sp. NPDC060186]